MSSPEDSTENSSQQSAELLKETATVEFTQEQTKLLARIAQIMHTNHLHEAVSLLEMALQFMPDNKVLAEKHSQFKGLEEKLVQLKNAQ